jgi:hypothetical protein
MDDLCEFAYQWLEYGNPSNCPYPADFAGNDCEITLEDFAMLSFEWLQCE